MKKSEHKNKKPHTNCVPGRKETDAKTCGSDTTGGGEETPGRGATAGCARGRQGARRGGAGDSGPGPAPPGPAPQPGSAPAPAPPPPAVRALARQHGGGGGCPSAGSAAAASAAAA